MYSFMVFVQNRIVNNEMSYLNTGKGRTVFYTCLKYSLFRDPVIN